MSIMKKVSIILIFLALFSFAFTGSVRAEVDWLGKLTEPIADFTLFLGDEIVNAIHGTIFNSWSALIRIDLTLSAGDVVGIIAGALLVVGSLVVVACVPGIREAAAAAAAAKFSVLAGGAAVAGAIIVAGGAAIGGTLTIWNSLPDDRLALPQYSISPEEIFLNKYAVFDVDFFNPQGYKIEEEIDDGYGRKEKITRWVQDYTLASGQTIQVSATAAQLQSIVSQWYGRLRDIAIVASLSILVYIGIRILLSSTSGDKAKYKQMIMDWVVALCLLFVMQYIMSFSNIIVDKITNLVETVSTNTDYIESPPYDDKVLNSLNKQADEVGATHLTKDDLGVYPANGKEYFTWKTNLMGHLRMGAQQRLGDSIGTLGWVVCFLALVFFTAFFIFTYLKRVLYMAFLTMIAPLVALTYPIDKINDGKAQAFNMWLKEYIFNLLIQPLHLLLYTILISSAFELASTNIIYSIVAIGFMMPAEKLMRKFFGFEKAQTPGMLNGAAGAALVMSGMQKLFNKGPKGGRDNSGNGGESDSDKENTKINTAQDKFDAGNAFSNGLDSSEENGRFYDDRNEKYSEDTPKIDSNETENPKPENNNNFDLDDENYNNYTAPTLDDENYNNYYRTQNPNDEKQRQRDIEEQRARLNAMRNSKSNSNRASENKPKNGLITGVKRAGRYWVGKKSNKISNKIKNGHYGRKAVRMAGGAFLGATAATVGLAAGVASGDPSKAAQYTAAGAAGGYTLGSKVTNKAVDMVSEKGTGKVFKEGYYGKDKLAEMETQKAVKAARRDTDLRFALEDKLGNKAAKEFLNGDALEDYYNKGIDLKNVDDIVTMAQMEADDMDRDKVIATKLYKDKLIGDKDSKYIGAKAEKENNSTLMRDAEKRGLSKDDQERYAEDINDHIRVFDDYKYGRKESLEQDYDKMQSHQMIKNVQRDDKLRKELESKIGKEKTQSFMKDGIREYESSGIDISKTDELVTMAQMENSGIKRNTVIGIRKNKDRLIGDRDSRTLGATEKKANNDILKKEAKDRRLNSEEQKKYLDDITKGINLYDDFKYGRRK